SSSTKVTPTQKGAGAAEVCTAAIAKSCSASVADKGHGQFYNDAHLAVGAGGGGYFAGCVRAGAKELTPLPNRLQKFESSGAFVEQVALPQESAGPNGLAVDSSGDSYVSYGDSILRYNPSGSLIGELSVALKTGEHAEATALAVDPSANLFAA